MQAGDEGLATAALHVEGLSEEEQAQADQEQAAWAAAEAAAAELMAEEEQAQAKQQQAVVKAAAKKAKKQKQKAKKQLQLPQAESSDQPTPSEASQPAAATPASDTSGRPDDAADNVHDNAPDNAPDDAPDEAPDNAPDSGTDLIQAMRPIAAMQPQQQQQGLLNRQPKAGAKNRDSKPASWAEICSVACAQLAPSEGMMSVGAAPSLTCTSNPLPCPHTLVCSKGKGAAQSSPSDVERQGCA